MPAAVQTLALTTLGISASIPTTIDNNGVTGFPAQTFTIVKEVIDIPEFGKTFNLVTHSPIGARAIAKFKGSFNHGSVTMTVCRDDNDAGQVIVKTASESDSEFSFEVTYADGSMDWFLAKVMSFTTVGGGVDSIINRSMQIELTSDVVEEP